MKVNEYISGTKGGVPTAETTSVGQDDKARPQAQPTPEQASGDRVELSEKSKQIARVRDLAESAPDIRRDKVEEIKAKLAAGTYQVNAEEIADKLLKGGLLEDV